MFIWGKFFQFGDKEKGLQIQQMDFWKKIKNICHILRKKKKKVARFRQCVLVGRKNNARFPKKSTCPPKQLPFTTN
jgi:hypothetical protein